MTGAKMKSSRAISAISMIVSALIFSAITGCSRDSKAPLSPALTPEVPGPVIPAGSIPEGHADVVTLPNGAEIVVENRGGVHFFRVEATFTDEMFGYLLTSTAALPETERRARLSGEIGAVFKKLEKVRALGLSQRPEVGYFTALVPYPAPTEDGQVRDILASVKTIDLGNSVIFNPAVLDREPLLRLRADRSENATRDPRASTEDYSGLARMGAVEFAKKAEGDIGGGLRVDGSSVRLGITDTGITLNHPTFRDASGKTRIQYMKDFTAEGRVYFHPQAKFDVTVPNGSEEDLLVTAQVIATPKLPALPAADKLVDLPQFRIKASAELKALLTKPGNGAKLGVLLEDVFQNEEGGELADINNNGKLKDKILLILIPGATPAQDIAFVDPSGTGDFRNSQPLGSWNVTQATIPMFAERVGFDFGTYELPTADGSAKIQVRGASIVGYDPGNHGSHVAGIAGGRKTIANDSDETLARGVAPAAALLMNRVCSNNFGCNAVEALVDMALEGHAEVINMSLGGLNPFNDGYGVQEVLINRLTFLKNTLFIISAGNSGPGHQTVGSPSVARMSLSVGASASRAIIERQYGWPGLGAQPGAIDDDFMLFFSSRGPSASGGFKPNLVAPGTELSSIQLNTAPGARGGLDVYWGTSMAAPAAAGAYALFLDAVKKFNSQHPEAPLSRDSTVLRRVLIETARPFDVRSFSPETRARTEGQYTWIDQGKGMLNLPAAWAKLMELRDNPVDSPVLRDGKPQRLDYEVLVPMISPAGVPYDGSRAAMPDTPAFGSGLYLDFFGHETLRQVHIARRLPFDVLAAPDAGELTAQLLTTSDEFVLETTIYGSDQQWLKAGVLDRLGGDPAKPCAELEAANLTVIGRGAEVNVKPDGTGTIVPAVASTLQICIDREMIARDLKPGDHGAVISAYRVVNGSKASAPSFEVPVYLAVPHKTMNDASAYAVGGTIRSFGVSRNYVAIPQGTSVVRVSLEVPALKLDSNGNPVAGEQCSGVELMGLQGSNRGALFPSRPAARATNCDAQGKPLSDLKSRRVVFSTTTPTAGLWDLHLFGLYKYAVSKYELRVDYVTASNSVKAVEGGLAALNGSFEWLVKSSTFPSTPDAQASAFLLSGLQALSEATVKEGAFVIIPGPMGEIREYPEGTKSVTVATGGSTGNDLDLMIFECDPAKAPAEACKPVAQSAGPTDEESASFVPKKGLKYLARVDGFTIKDTGKFTSTETISLEPQAGTLDVVTQGAVVIVRHSMPEDQLGKGLLESELFRSKKYDAVGSIVLRTPDKLVLGSVPVKIRAE